MTMGQLKIKIEVVINVDTDDYQDYQFYKECIRVRDSKVQHSMLMDAIADHEYNLYRIDHSRIVEMIDSHPGATKITDCVPLIYPDMKP